MSVEFVGRVTDALGRTAEARRSFTPPAPSAGRPQRITLMVDPNPDPTQVPTDAYLRRFDMVRFQHGNRSRASAVAGERTAVMLYDMPQAHTSFTPGPVKTWLPGHESAYHHNPPSDLRPETRVRWTEGGQPVYMLNLRDPAYLDFRGAEYVRQIGTLPIMGIWQDGHLAPSSFTVAPTQAQLDDWKPAMWAAVRAWKARLGPGRNLWVSNFVPQNTETFRPPWANWSPEPYDDGTYDGGMLELYHHYYADAPTEWSLKADPARWGFRQGKAAYLMSRGRIFHAYSGARWGTAAEQMSCFLFCYCSFLLEAVPGLGWFNWNQSWQHAKGYEEPKMAVMERDIGLPLGPRAQVAAAPSGSIWKRAFQGAVVYVNPGGETRTAEGRTMGPRTAVIEP